MATARMRAMDTHFWLVLLTFFLLAGLVKGLAGFGLPTVAVALMALTLSPVAAAAVMILPSLLTNLWQYARGVERLSLLRRLLGLNLGIVAGTWWGFLPSLAQARDGTRLLIGAVLLAYGLLGLLRWRPPSPGRHGWWLGPAAGYVGGALSAASGIFVVPVIMYLQSLGLRKEALVTALGLCFSVATLALGTEVAGAVRARPELMLASLLALAPALLGMELGQRLRRRLDELVFQRGFMVAIALLGAYLMWQALR